MTGVTYAFPPYHRDFHPLRGTNIQAFGFVTLATIRPVPSIFHGRQVSNAES